MLQNLETGWHECVVEASRRVPGFINATIGYSGISASPATAVEVVKILRQSGLELQEDPDFSGNRKDIPHFSKLSDDEKRELISEDPRFGHVICSCEHVTEGEVVAAIERGATTRDGVKFRTRAGMGRCQAGFCAPRVTKILSRELGIPEEKVTKKGGKSRHLHSKTKELLEE